MNAHDTDRRIYRRRDPGFAIGLLTGAVAGAGLALWFAPRLAAELRERVLGSAGDLRHRAADRYGQLSAGIGKVADVVTQRVQDARDGAADVVADGAHEVERFAKAVKTR